MAFKDPERCREYQRKYQREYKRKHYPRHRKKLCKYQQEHRIHKIETDPEYVERNRLADLKHQRQYKERYPEKVKARQAVSDAIKIGRLVRPETCSKCGVRPETCRNGRTRIHAHHENYAKRLEVIWLCWGCHELIHHQFEV